MKRLTFISLVLLTIVMLVCAGCTTEQPIREVPWTGEGPPPPPSPGTRWIIPGEESTPTPPSSEQAVTETTVHNAIRDLSGTDVVLGKCITKIEVHPHAGTADPNDFIVHVYFHPDAIWDEEDAMEKAVHTSIKAMEVLFQNDKISEVVMWEELDFTDKYGETETETAIRLIMEKEVADKIADWEKVDDRAWADYNTFFDLAELQYVHPAIMKGL